MDRSAGCARRKRTCDYNKDSSCCPAAGRRERTPGDPRPAVDGHTTLDLNLRHQPGHGLEVYLSGRNLLDDDIREPAVSPLPDSVPLPGRSVSLGFSKER
ncbi:MAG: hypothetical protein K0R03_223 [Moraxellaceae bacterium]|nr:hypothetical protein [Moraxellaceae bacterium]